MVGASIALGAAIGAVSLPIGLRGQSLKWKIAGALLLTIAICSHHFTAMAAVSIIPDPTIAVSTTALPVGWLAIAVAVASLAIILFAFAGLAVDIRDRRRGELEADRMRGLANAAVEGLLVCDGETIVAVNDSFGSLMGTAIDELVGATLETCFPDATTRAKLIGRPNVPLEAELRCADGTATPVELILRPVDFAGKVHNAIAVRDLRARKQAEQHIRFLAHNDALTGLANRSSFNWRLDQEIEAQRAGGHPFAVLCLDLDRFKEVNDLFGHATGDTVLQTVARCVTGVLDQDQMMARLGGDEFAIIVPGLSDPTVAGRVAENILDALRAENRGSRNEALVSTSIGIAICPNDAIDRQTFSPMRTPHSTSPRPKAAIPIDSSRDRSARRCRDRRQLEHDLRHAIARQEFKLVYQPQKDVKTGETVGFEALLRWSHATRGDMSPALFIPIAEEGSAILPIGEWVLRTACREAVSWTCPLTIAVNVSPVQVHNAHFPQLVHEILLQTGLPAKRLELEITETALVRDLHRALSTLRQLKALGVRIAMDDFGTGYSSLANLRAFPFDKIKIDRSFVQSVDSNEQAATIVRAVLGLGRDLGCRCWRKVSKRRASSSSLRKSSATRSKATSLADLPRSDSFTISRTRAA